MLRPVGLLFRSGAPRSVVEIHQAFLRWTSFWSSILDTVNRLLLKQHRCISEGYDLWMLSTFCWWISVLVFHQTHWLLGLVRVVGKECPFLRSFRFCFWSGSLPMLSVLRWGLSNGELQWLEPFGACQWLVVSDSSFFEVYQTLFLR